MAVTLGTKTLNCIRISEESEVKGSSRDTWENSEYKRRLSVIGLLRKWTLDCVEKDVDWSESAAKYLREQAAQASKLDFTVDLGDLYAVNTQVQVLGCNLRLPAIGKANVRHFTVKLMEASPFSQSLDESCVLFLPFDEGSGETVYDKSGYGNNGSLLPSGSGPNWVNGKYGKALEFDGIDDYVDVDFLDTVEEWNELTVSLWVKLLSTPDHIADAYIGSPAWGQEGGFLVYTGTSGTCSARLRNDPQDTETTCGFEDNVLNEWRHYVFVFNRPTLKTYVNGKWTGHSATWDYPVRTDGHITIGRWAGGYQNCVIDEVRIYNRALSADEVYQAYLSGAARIGAKSVTPTNISENFELVGSEWDAFENQSYIRKLAVIGQKRHWMVECVENGVPWNYSAYKYLQYKAWKGELVPFAVRDGSRYETEEVEAYILSLNVDFDVTRQGVRKFMVALREA